MIRVGVVGFGMAGRVFHAPLLSSVDGMELAAVVERVHQKSGRTLPRHNHVPLRSKKCWPILRSAFSSWPRQTEPTSRSPERFSVRARMSSSTSQ